MNRTIVIWDEVNANIRFFIVNKNLSHLNRKYVNSEEISKQMAQEITDLVYDKEGNYIIDLLNSFPIDFILSGASVIVCGFLP